MFNPIGMYGLPSLSSRYRGSRGLTRTYCVATSRPAAVDNFGSSAIAAHVAAPLAANKTTSLADKRKIAILILSNSSLLTVSQQNSTRPLPESPLVAFAATPFTRIDGRGVWRKVG